QEIGDIGAGNEQNDGDRSHEYPQDLADIANDLLLQRLNLWAKSGVFEQLTVESGRRRPCLQPDRKHASEIRVCLFQRDAWLQSRNALITELAEKDFVAIE